MSTLGWVFLGVAFLVLIMVANNSWQSVWDRIRNVKASPPAQTTTATPPSQPQQTPPADIVRPGNSPTNAA